jgi:hypothetical protein
MMVPQLLASERQRHLMGAFSRKGRRAAERALPLGIEDAKASPRAWSDVVLVHQLSDLVH